MSEVTPLCAGFGCGSGAGQNNAFETRYEPISVSKTKARLLKERRYAQNGRSQPLRILRIDFVCYNVGMKIERPKIPKKKEL